MTHRLDVYQFSKALERAKKKVKTILDTTRNPDLPKKVPHAYVDKFSLAEMCTKTAIAANLNIFDTMGMTQAHHAEIQKWVQAKKSVTFRFENEESCKFDRETTREVESKSKYVKETTSGFTGNTTTETHKVVTTVTDYFWTFDCKWSLRVYPGADPNTSDAITLRSRAYRREIKTSSKSTPRPPKLIETPREVNVTWIFSNFDPKSKGYQFLIDRTDPKKCRTPSRNPDIEKALNYFNSISYWGTAVYGAIERNRSAYARNCSIPKENVTFALVAAVFSFEKKDDASSLLVTDADYNAFMQEHERSLKEQLSNQAKALKPASDRESAYSVTESGLIFGTGQMKENWNCFRNAIASIERMLRDQVVAAIGKEVRPSDFAEYMDFHYSRLFRPEYRPRPFCYAIRLPGQFPQGTLSIEDAANSSDGPQPIRTAVMVAPPKPMKFALNAATDVHFNGDRFVHATVFHRFSNSPISNLQLCARARQFSSFVLLVGKIADANTFAPTSAMIVKDKDDLRIPLMLETIPTPKEFRDAIESLSPEQQRFCKAFRSMQLASTLFAVCVIEIKPQLEKVLNLPPGSLTKEIALTQGLSELFIKYQIPPDLLSYDGDKDKSTRAKLGEVQSHHDSIQKVIEAEKQKEIEEERKRVEKQHALELARTRRYDAPTVGGGPVRREYKMMSRAVTMSCAMPCPAPPAAVSRSMATRGPVMAKGGPSKPKPGGATKKASPSSKPATKTPDKKPSDIKPDGSSKGGPALDYTSIPTALDAQYEALDEDGSLRPTIIKAGSSWTLRSQDGLLSDPKTTSVSMDGQKTARNAAFDLLDALTRSGAVSVDCASLHVVLAATHCFDLSLMDSIVIGNLNPIEKVERSQLIMCTTIQQKSASELIEDSHVARIGTYSPMLITDGDGGASKEAEASAS